MADKLDGVKNAEVVNEDENQEDEEYDPFSDRPEGPLTSDFAALMHLVKCSIGSGILFLPNAFRRTGYVMSVVCGVIVGLICTHTAVTLVRCAQALCRRNRIPMLDFAKTAEISFLTGPPTIRKYGRTFGVITNVIICLVHFQTSVIYILYVATSFQQVIEFFSGFEMNVRIYILIVFPFVCGLGLVPNLKYLTPFSVIGFVFLTLGVCTTLHYLLHDFPNPGRLDMYTYFLPVPMFCSIFLFALHNVTLYLPLENSMKNPGHLSRLIIYSMLFNICLYVAFGFLGYNKYEKACDTVIKNLPIEETLAQVVKIAIALSVLFTFGLAYYVPISVLWPMIQPKYRLEEHYVSLFRFVGVILITLLAIAVPEMVPLLGLFAAIGFTTTMLLIPILIETATKWNEATRSLLAKNTCILIVWILLLIAGSIESTWSIVREYGNIKEEECR